MLEEQLAALEVDQGEEVAENEVLGRAVDALEVQLKGAEGRAAAALRRAAEAEAKAASTTRTAAAVVDSQAQVEIELQRLRHKSTSDRILLQQAERGRHAAGQELAAAREQAAALRGENADLQARLTAAQRQLRQLESLQSFSDQWEEQQQREQQLCSALERANSSVRQLEGRCAALEEELAATASALRAARQLADAHAPEAHSPRSPKRRAHQQQQAAGRHERQQQQRADSLSWSDLCDLEGLVSQLEGFPGGSPAHSPLRSSSRHRMSQIRQQWMQNQQLREDPHSPLEGAGQLPDVQDAEEEQALPASLQRQLLAQQRQLALLQAQLQQQQQQPASEPEQALRERVQQLEAQVERLKARNIQLQTALADASMQAARAAAAARKEMVAAQEEASQLRQQRDEVAMQLAQLQSAAAVLSAECDASSEGAKPASKRLEALQAELFEYAGRCNAVVEQNAALLQEKKQWLDRLHAAEAEAGRCRSEAQQLRLHHIQLLSGGMAPGGKQQQQQQQQDEQQEALVQQALEAQAAESALRSVLAEAREEQVAACKALAAELRRVHALERVRISDVQEQQQLQQQLQQRHKECKQLASSLVELQRQLAAAKAKRPQLLDAWGLHKAGSSGDFRIATFQVDAAASD